MAPAVLGVWWMLVQLRTKPNQFAKLRVSCFGHTNTVERGGRIWSSFDGSFISSLTHKPVLRGSQSQWCWVTMSVVTFFFIVQSSVSLTNWHSTPSILFLSCLSLRVSFGSIAACDWQSALSTVIEQKKNNIEAGDFLVGSKMVYV